MEKDDSEKKLNQSNVRFFKDEPSKLEKISKSTPSDNKENSLFTIEKLTKSYTDSPKIEKCNPDATGCNPDGGGCHPTDACYPDVCSPDCCSPEDCGPNGGCSPTEGCSPDDCSPDDSDSYTKTPSPGR